MSANDTSSTDDELARLRDRVVTLDHVLRLQFEIDQQRIAIECLQREAMDMLLGARPVPND